MDCTQRADRVRRIKEAASRLMHLHDGRYGAEEAMDLFAPAFTWVGAGGERSVSGPEETAAFFRRLRSAAPACRIWDERYDVTAAGEGTDVCSGAMWISAEPAAGRYVEARQQVSLVFQWLEGRPRCVHIHCSGPYGELTEGEAALDRAAEAPDPDLQERLRQLEREALQKNRQLEVVMASIPGGLKISRDDAEYSFAYVSREAAALFGYTVEEFLAMSGGTAAGAVYAQDRDRAVGQALACFEGGRAEYSAKYRVPCKDGSLKWILDSGRKCLNEQGETMINSLYLDITASELAAQEVLRQKELLGSIYDTVPCGILRFARHRGRYDELISINRTALALLGYADEDACRRDWHTGGTAGAVLEEDRPLLEQSCDCLSDVGQRQDAEWRVRWKDGSIHWLSGSNVLVGREDGRDILQRMMFDVTESRRLRQQLEREQELYRVAMESSSDVLYEYRIEEDLFRSYEPRTGPHGQESVFQSDLPNYRTTLRALDIVHPEDVSAVIDNICGGLGGVFEVRLRTPHMPKGSGYRWHRITGKVISHGGRPVRVVGTLRNIHAAKETLSASAEALRWNQSALEAISGSYVSIYCADLQKGRYFGVRTPPAGSGLSIPQDGSIREELARYVRAHVHPEEQARLLPLCDPDTLRRRLDCTQNQLAVEFRHVSPHSPEGLWLRMEAHPMAGEGGAPQGAVVAFRNVTEERRLELERRQEEQRAKRALEEAYEAARRANLAKSDFLSRMSHDIRTPMNAILGMTAIAQRSLEDRGRVEDCLHKIGLSGNHLLQLINEVLDMSKIESENVSLQEDAFRLPDTARTVLEMLRDEAEGKELQLALRHMELRHETVCGDQVRLQQILLNLLSNAVKYTPRGGHVTLDIQETRSFTSGVGCFLFTVEDDGIGMTEEFQRRIFQPFERAEDPRVRQVQGTGLGMAIAWNLARMMNGTIQVESRPDRGTRFLVTVYLKLSGPGAVSQPPRPDAALPSLEGRRVLLVEDNELNREIARTLLEMSGVEVEEAVDGQEAVARFSSLAPGHFHLILMDIQMPVMDGYQAARAIRALDRPDAAEVPIIALTANAFADDVRRAREAGMNEHLAKPLSVEELTQALRRWL